MNPSEDSLPPWYRYVVLFACFTSVFLSGGIGSGTASTYHLYWMDIFGEENAKISTIGSLSVGLCSGLGPLASILSNTIGSRKTVILGGVLSTVGMIGAGFAPNTTVLLLSYGLLTGSAWCLAYLPCFVGATYYFPTSQHAIVMGVSSSAMGLGPFVAPLFVEWLSGHYTWRGALIIQAGINLNIVICGMTLLPHKEQHSRQNFLRFDLFKNPYYINVLLATLLSALGLSVIFVHLGYVVETSLNVSERENFLVLTILGLGSFIGRLSHGFVATRVNVVYQYIFSMVLQGTLTAIMPKATNLIVIYIMSSVIGLMVGAYGTVPPIIVNRIVDPEARTSANGYQQFVLGSGVVVGAPLAGYLYDRTGNYAASLYVGGGLLIGAGMMKLIFIRQWNRYLAECAHDINLDDTRGASAIEVERADTGQVDRGGFDNFGAHIDKEEFEQKTSKILMINLNGL